MLISQFRRMFGKPVMQGIFGTVNYRHTGPQGIIEVQGDEFDATREFSGIHAVHVTHSVTNQEGGNRDVHAEEKNANANH
mgnify:CR=1 FL=1